MGTFGLGILFLLISPALRLSLLNDLSSLQHTVELYSPFSYVGIALAVLAGLMFCLHRAAQPRT